MRARTRTGMLTALALAGLLVACSCGASPSAAPEAAAPTSIPTATADVFPTPTSPPTATATPPAQTATPTVGPTPAPSAPTQVSTPKPPASAAPASEGEASPLPTITSPTWASRVTFKVRWGVSPTPVAVVAYDVRYQSFTWTDEYYGPRARWLSATKATMKVFRGTPGFTYCFEVRARYADGGVSPWSGEYVEVNEDYGDGWSCTTIPTDDRLMARSAGWYAGTDPRFYRQTFLRTFRHGATLKTRSGVAEGIAIVATTCPTCGKVEVYFRRRLLNTVSLYLARRVDRVRIPVTPSNWYGFGAVTIKVVSRDKEVIIDGVSFRRVSGD